MKYTIYPTKSEVIASFMKRLDAVNARLLEPGSALYNPGEETLRAYDKQEKASIEEQIALIQSDAGHVIKVEFEA